MPKKTKTIRHAKIKKTLEEVECIREQRRRMFLENELEKKRLRLLSIRKLQAPKKPFLS